MVTVELVGEDSRELPVDADTVYGDLLAPFDVSHHEVSILVDGTPVPEDATVDPAVERVRVLRLVAGGTDGRPRD